jgi:hypothetical protein
VYTLSTHMSNDSSVNKMAVMDSQSLLFAGVM